MTPYKGFGQGSLVNGSAICFGMLCGEQIWELTKNLIRVIKFQVPDQTYKQVMSDVGLEFQIQISVPYFNLKATGKFKLRPESRCGFFKRIHVDKKGTLDQAWGTQAFNKSGRGDPGS